MFPEIKLFLKSASGLFIAGMIAILVVTLMLYQCRNNPEPPKVTVTEAAPTIAEVLPKLTGNTDAALIGVQKADDTTDAKVNKTKASVKTAAKKKPSVKKPDAKPDIVVVEADFQELKKSQITELYKLQNELWPSFTNVPTTQPDAMLDTASIIA